MEHGILTIILAGHGILIKWVRMDTVFSKIQERDTIFAYFYDGTVYSKMGHGIRSSGGRLHLAMYTE